MVFSSILFLFRFMPIAFLLYYLTPKKMKNLALFVLSLIFYSWGEPKYFPIMLLSVIIDYTVGQGIKRNPNNVTKKRLFLLVSIFANLGLLFFFKYTNFFVGNINSLLGTQWSGIVVEKLPLGISFYTFQTMSYSIDVYRGKVEAEDNIINFGAYVVMFPQLIAGPIVTYADVSRELKYREITLAQIDDGVRLFIMGLGSKVLIANNIGSLWTEVQMLGFANVSTPLAWLGVLAFSLQIYFDFSGYSLMAIGLGKMLGFQFPQNFNYPYISRSITEFWRRWHMTLGSWFREYVYIPMGGNRVTPARHIFNMFVVWFLTGFWHGANWNFILWGLYFFTFLVIEKRFLKQYLDKSQVLSRVYTLSIVIVSWAIFAVSGMEELKGLFSKMFAFQWGGDWLYYLQNYGITFILAVICSTPVLKKMYEKWGSIQWLKAGFLMVVAVISVAYLVDSTYNPFLYFNF